MTVGDLAKALLNMPDIPPDDPYITHFILADSDLLVTDKVYPFLQRIVFERDQRTIAVLESNGKFQKVTEEEPIIEK